MTFAVPHTASLAYPSAVTAVHPIDLPAREQTMTPLSSLFTQAESQPTLPMLTVKQKGQDGMHAYVTAYVVGTKRELMTDGTARIPLYYLSIIGASGQGTTLRGIFASLASQRLGDGTLDGVGTVALAHHQSSLASAGRWHWQYDQVVLPAGVGLHGILESPFLTCYDPLQGQMAGKVRRSRSTAGNGRLLPATGTETGTRPTRGKKRSKDEACSLSTARTTKARADEQSSPQRDPLFLLLVPGSKANDAPFLHHLHYAFLDRRVPWPLHPAWATFLWQRGLRSGEIEALTVWGYVPPSSTGPAVSLPVAAAYLCRPRVADLAHDLSGALARGQLSRL